MRQHRSREQGQQWQGLGTGLEQRPALAERAREYWRLARMDRPIGIFLLLWPTLWCLWIAADGWPDAKLLFIFVLGTVLMRAAGCCVNDYADRDFDPHVSRTRQRPLARRAISPREALLLCASLCALAFVLVLFTNRLTVLMSFAALGLALIYPFSKRFTHLAQLFLGAAFSWGGLMAFTAQSGSLPAAAWLLYLGNFLWTVAYDTEYAMADRDDDLKIGVKSTAILFGDADRLIIGVLQALTLACLALAGRQFGLGAWYFAGLAVAAGLFLYHQWLIRDREPQACFKAFLHNNWVGMAIFAGTVLAVMLPG